ncbi:MAG: DNA replication and repair protein RecF [Bacteroidetes bacterium 4572_77]|nr:MAG: DNA replication and repair protein RecF [Bacteroidetes bacterium 4572_77]
MKFSPKINCFIGANGAGKTNILDAIYYLSFCKSYFNPIDSQNIKHKENFFAIHGFYEHKNGSPEKVQCLLKPNKKKQFKLNDKEYNRLADHIGMIPLVMISPYDRDLINNHSDVRRKYLDGVISQFNGHYLHHLLQYNKSLLQRNALLKSFAENHYFDAELLAMWEEKLIEHGEPIFEERTTFIKDFLPIFQKYFQFISPKNEEVSIQYTSQLQEQNWQELLLSNIQKDKALRRTTSGIHKDDLEFNIGQYPIKKFGSQGQQKSFVIAIKLAQFEYMRLIKKQKPILLLDDIFDKLDSNRVTQIIQLVNQEEFGQVFITDTQKERIEHIFKDHIIDHKIFKIENQNINSI